MYWNWMIAGYVVVVCAASLLLFESSVNPALLLLIALIYAASHFASHRKLTAWNYVQHILLIAFHWASGSDWCLALYIAHLGTYFFQERKLKLSLEFWLLLVSYTVIAAAKHPLDSMSSVAAVLFAPASLLVLGIYFKNRLRALEQEQLTLKKEKKHLSTHDTLTGLINFEEFHRQLEELVHTKEKLLLALIDCKDLKSHNTESGFDGVNDMLKLAAKLLRELFPHASCISRIGGDEFAIVMAADKLDDVNAASELLTKEFPKLTGLEINYGTALFPQDGLSKDELILVAERKLYRMKRESWLKKEEHMLRSEKLRVVGELASGMAHEIRNPLTTVKGFLQLSKADHYNIEPWYELIMDEINRMSLLTGEFLQFSKPHTNQFKPHSIDLCIARVISLLETEAARLGHKLIFEADTTPLYMMMDQDKMVQLLLNLGKNALEAIDENGLVLIKLRKVNDHACLEISDNGKGIRPEELEQIFLPFYTTKEAGTGLGLSICHKIVQDHDGTIAVNSQIGKGTTFTMLLPLIDMEAKKAALTKSRESFSSSAL